MGFSVSKKVGKSVVRNKIRRRFKEAFMCLEPSINKSVHIIFLARAAVSEASYKDIKKDMAYLLKKAGLYGECA